MGVELLGLSMKSTLETTTHIIIMTTRQLKVGLVKDLNWTSYNPHQDVG